MTESNTKKPRIGVFIIAYNAVNHLIDTINRIPPDVYDLVEEIFVIDDCSKDKTYYAALGYKHAHDVKKIDGTSKRGEPRLRRKSESRL